MPLTWRVTQSPVSAMCWAALAWVASASSSRDGEKSAAKCTARKTSSSKIHALPGDRSEALFTGGIVVVRSRGLAMFSRKALGYQPDARTTCIAKEVDLRSRNFEEVIV